MSDPALYCNLSYEEETAALDAAIAERLAAEPVTYCGDCEADPCTCGVEVYGVKGLKNTPFRKAFKSQAAFEKWLGKNAADVEVHGTRKV